jgi:hypothetical protein
MAVLVAVATVAAGVILADDHGQWQSMDTGVKFARQNPHPIESPAAAPNPSRRSLITITPGLTIFATDKPGSTTLGANEWKDRKR